MKGKKLQTEERHKGLQHQCNSRGQQRGAEPGTNHRCELQQPLQRERGLNLPRARQRGRQRAHALRGAGTKRRSGKPSPPLPLPPGCGTRGEPACARRQLQPLPGTRGTPGSRPRPVCCEGCSAPRSASPSCCPSPGCGHPHGFAGHPQTPGQGGGTGAQSPAQDGAALAAAAAGRAGLHARSSPGRDVRSGPRCEI